MKRPVIDTPWVPVITVDLKGLTPKAFEELQKAFYATVKDRPLNLGKFLNTGWHTITPEIAEEALLGKANRKISLADVQHYARQMEEGKWQPTGETVCVDKNGVMRQGYHRSWASYLSGASFRTFVVADVDLIPDIFAYYDAGRARSSVDALQTAGLNGSSGMISAVVKIALCYDLGHYDKKRNVKMPRLTQFELLDYVRSRPELRDIIVDTLAEYSTILDALYGRKKDVMCFAACRIVKAHGVDLFEDFMTALEDDTLKQGPVFLLRQKLEKDMAGGGKNQKPLSKKDVLAFTIMVFNAWHAGKAMKNLKWGTDEPMPEFDVPDPNDDVEVEAETEQSIAAE